MDWNSVPTSEILERIADYSDDKKDDILCDYITNKYQLLQDEPLFDAVQRGAAIGALAVMSAGDNEGLPDRETLTEYMRKLH